jgi:hypothetical protein
METKSYKYILLGTFTFFLGSKTIFAQNEKHCGTTEATQVLQTANPELKEKEISYNKALAQQIQQKKQLKSTEAAEAIYTIPIVFHIIHQNGSENISDAQILDEVAILNRDYAKLNPDTADIIANTPYDTLATNIHIQFRLARLDPNGNCTNGIDRIYSHRTNNADDASKLNPWPRNKYLNVWVVKSIGDVGVAGYAYFPADVDATPNKDGVLILHDYIGSIGTSSENTSRALTHEIGHYLSLYHPWGGTNSPEVACGDDAVNDTPVTMGHLSCDLFAPHCDATAFSSPYHFNGVTLTSGTTDTSTLTTSFGANFGHFSAVGVSSNPSDSMRFSFAKWDTGAMDSATVYDSLTGSINTSKYYEVTVTPAFGSSMSLTAMSFSFQRSATGVRTYAVRSSVNNFASNLAASISPANTHLAIKGTNEFFLNLDTTSSQGGSKITFSGASYTNTITPITFRIYGWNAEDSLGTFSIDNVTFTGTAGTIENTQNYMDYSYCSVMFTKGQKERMRTALENSTSGRNHLWKASNLAATGTDVAGQAMAVCIPHPDFYSTTTTGTSICTNVCAGGSLKFNKYITLGTATNTVWEFEGGTPATSTSSTPTVLYSAPGNYTVKLTASNSTGGDSLIKLGYIHVSEAWPQYTGLAIENFDNTASGYYWNWWVNNYDNNPYTWQHTNVAGFSGNSSMVMHGHGNYVADVDDFITPNFDLSHVTGASLTFRCAAASSALNAADLNDALKIYTSTNCGQTWAIRTTLSGNTLNNNFYHPEDFVPSSQSQWALQTVTVPNSVATSNVRFKFEYTSGAASNNIYIDDINIIGVLGVNETNMDAANVSVYPNPANQAATISYHLNKKSDVKIDLVDMLGKKIMTTANNNQAEGDYSFDISKQQYNINGGIYFIKLSVDNAVTTKKLIFTE